MGPQGSGSKQSSLLFSFCSVLITHNKIFFALFPFFLFSLFSPLSTPILPPSGLYFAVAACSTAGLAGPSSTNQGSIVFVGLFTLFGVPIYAYTLGIFSNVATANYIQRKEKENRLAPITVEEFLQADQLGRSTKIFFFVEYFFLCFLCCALSFTSMYSVLTVLRILFNVGSSTHFVDSFAKVEVQTIMLHCLPIDRSINLNLHFFGFYEMEKLTKCNRQEYFYFFLHFPSRIPCYCCTVALLSFVEITVPVPTFLTNIFYFYFLGSLFTNIRAFCVLSAYFFVFFFLVHFNKFYLLKVTLKQCCLILMILMLIQMIVLIRLKCKQPCATCVMII